ncbi:MAG: CCA tRNA nucleotidyltransferase [Desulfuromonadales bacterium]|nr:MAG: CCA tRNA nucleotidyltransferase [Desulfuromonadales bacterium]
MDSRIATFLAMPPLEPLRHLTTDLGVQGYVVGGCLRDLLLGREVNDVDIAVAGGAERLAYSFAQRVGGTFFWLDEERGHARVVTRREGAVVTVDFAPLRGESINADLELRDFTINALAIPLAEPQEVIDPLGGQTDILRRNVRACSSRAFVDDPLRLVRAYRFAAVLGFGIDEATVAMIPGHAPLLTRVAGERIREELFRILAIPAAAVSFRQMGETGLLTAILGTDQKAVALAVTTLAGVEEIAGRFSLSDRQLDARLRDRLAQDVQEGVTVLSLMKLAGLAWRCVIPHGITIDRLKLGTAAGSLMGLLSSVDSIPPGVADAQSCYRYFSGHEPAGLELPLQAHALGLITEDHCRELVAFCLRSYIPRGARLLLTGEDVMALLGIQPGRAVGAALEILREAQSLGNVTTAHEASACLAKKLLTTKDPMS